ncbi:MAG TPA: Holliday junction branch migration protein RuvA [Myxococcaceae bacterium]|nr:Holliday junction branch migration protein RuvA [Myxococcaceae bacterium]
MIARLRGTVMEKGLQDAVVDVQGVGYRVAFSLLSLARLPPEGRPADVRVRTVLREDALELVGFLSAEEEQMYLLLTSVSHVGPKLALVVLSGLEVGDLADALARGDLARLTRIHGVGKKTAERLVLELREKAKALAAGQPAAGTPGARRDLVSALENLGYRASEATGVADAVAARLGPEAPFEALFREALRTLRAG